jgi:hypothetical protein
MPTILADNGGHDSSDLVSRLRAAHYEGQSDAGLGEIRDVIDTSRSNVLTSFACRHGQGRDRLDEKTRSDGELQVEEAGRRQC